jgi:hypothetical protein
MNYPDYPNNPTVNQEFTLPSGITMKWDGEKWKVVPIPSDDTLRQDLAAEDSTVLVGGIKAAVLVALASSGGGGGETFITLEQFDQLAGTGGNDTAAFEAACATSWNTGLPVKLLNKTYLIDAKLFNPDSEVKLKGGLYGVGPDSVIKSRTRFTDPSDLDSRLVLYFFNLNGITLADFTFDGDISDDPITFNSSNYNSFYGSRGITINGCTNVTVRNVHTKNTMRAGISFYRSKRASVKNCTATRCRGNFGDGFYFDCEDFVVSGCNAYDYTRIGYVCESFNGTTNITNNGLFLNCVAEYGHDSSKLYGGHEFNVGFWFENYYDVHMVRCKVKNQTHRGCVFTPHYWESSNAVIKDMRFVATSADNVTIEDCGFGFVVRSLRANFDNIVSLTNCHIRNTSIGIYNAPDSNSRSTIDVKNCTVSINTAMDTTMAVMHLGGPINIDGLTVTYKVFDSDRWNDPDLSYSTIGHFGGDCGTKLTVKNLIVYNNDNVEIPARFKFLSTALGKLDLTVEGCWLDNIINRGKNITYKGTKFAKLGADTPTETLTYDRCTVNGMQGTGLMRQPVMGRFGQTDVLFTNCIFDYTASGDYLYLFNESHIDSSPFIRVHGCRFIKDFTTGPQPYAIRVDGNPTLKTTTHNVYNLEIANCTFENIGGSTSNPILDSGFTVLNNAKVYGTGNYKSATLLVDTTGNIESNF